jgi:uncharacterized protein (UPF0332 family)
VTPEAADHLEKAHRCLRRGRTILAVDVYDVAAREAYLAAFHAAQALIAERAGRAAKTHRGVHVQFARLTKNEPRLDVELRQFLPKSYHMNATTDYGVDPGIGITSEQAVWAINTADRFIQCVTTLLS